MTLETIREKYIGKRLNLYLIDGEEVTRGADGTLSIDFRAEIFEDEALDVTRSLCKAHLTLDENDAVTGIEPLFCQQELELDEDDYLLLECTPNEDHYLALHYALMCAVIRD